MQTFVRTSMTGGVALIGASAIALSPLVVTPQQVHPPAIPVSSIAATLTASTTSMVDPFTEWVQVLTTTFNNLAAIGQQIQASPAPILKQIIANQIGYATTISTALGNAGGAFVAAAKALPSALLQAAQQVAAGQISAGLSTAYTAALALVVSPGFALIQSPILNIPGQVLQNITNFVNLVPTFVGTLGLSALYTASGVESAFGDTAQAVYDAVGAGDFGAAVNAIVNAPAVLTNAFLNGYAPAASWGILTPVTSGTGLVPVFIGFRDLFAQKLGAPVSSTAAAVTSSRAAAAPPTPAATVTLDTTPATATASPRTATSTRGTASTKATPAAADNTSAGSENNTQPAETHNTHGAAAGGSTSTGSSARKAGHANRTH
ncbi:hypothetical protein MSAR_46920 [Mycolicibacterium sarraceniae]|uniref:PE-PGRS family protein n=2 Tax=Mycolicibacterium sarraceniae TaxID=1534348 RepID=A0A7I7T0G9_9MYCO|nr:hypothetical protein MSAR_46920 [Mycolicibacterium sarraceniae]